MAKPMKNAAWIKGRPFKTANAARALRVGLNLRFLQKQNQTAMHDAAGLVVAATAVAATAK